MCIRNSKKILTGVYGGSFNPIHIGHTSMAHEIVSCGLVDELWLVVSPQNPLKTDGLWDDAFRLELARIATDGLACVKVSDVEFYLPKPNYMFTTLQFLSKKHPEREFVLIIGMDNWACFSKWYRWQDIIKQYRLIVLPRNSGGVTGDVSFAIPPFSAGVTFADVKLVDMSSSWVRTQIARNPLYDGAGLLPSVWEKILSKKL